jgi:hypothetical protein
MTASIKDSKREKGRQAGEESRRIERRIQLDLVLRWLLQRGRLSIEQRPTCTDCSSGSMLKQDLGFSTTPEPIIPVRSAIEISDGDRRVAWWIVDLRLRGQIWGCCRVFWSAIRGSLSGLLPQVWEQWKPYEDTSILSMYYYLCTACSFPAREHVAGRMLRQRLTSSAEAAVNRYIHIHDIHLTS